MEDNRKRKNIQKKGSEIPTIQRRTVEEERRRMQNASAGLRMPGSDVSVETDIRRRKLDGELRQQSERKQEEDIEDYRAMGEKKSMSKKVLARRKKNKRLWKILGAEIVLFSILIIGYGVFYANDKLNKMNYNELDEEDLGINEGLSEEPVEKYTTIALFGIDARDVSTDTGNRSDTIMIASIDNETKEVRIVSVYRDNYFEIENPNNGKCDDMYTKATHAYGYGGPKAAVATLNKNLDLQIRDYVTVNFASLTDVIDDLGGIEVEVDSDEMYGVNLYIAETAEVAGKSYTPLTQTGMVTLDGLQATTYCRVRYETAGGDIGRAERQREVVQAILTKAKKADLATLNTILDDVLPKISTSLSKKELLTLMSGIFDYDITETSGFPFVYKAASAYDEPSGQNLSVIVAGNLQNNVVLLHEFLYDLEPASGYEWKETEATEDDVTGSATETSASTTEALDPSMTYTPSSEVRRISKEIETNLGIYPPDDPEFRGQY